MRSQGSCIVVYLQCMGIISTCNMKVAKHTIKMSILVTSKNLTLTPKDIQFCVRVNMPDTVTLHLIYFRSNGAY